MPVTFPDKFNDPELFVHYLDDFNQPASATASDVQTYTSVNDGATGANAFQDVAIGAFNVVTAAADNDYQSLRTISKNYVFATTKRLWLDIRFRVSEATTLESTWWMGFIDTLTTGGFQANTSGPLASYTGAIVYKTPETALTVNAQVSAVAVQSTASAIATSVSNTYSRVQIYWDGVSQITAHYFNGTSWASQSFPFTAGTTAMYLLWGIKAGPTAAAETLQVDYVRTCQDR
jgi:hypothetical protein